LRDKVLEHVKQCEIFFKRQPRVCAWNIVLYKKIAAVRTVVRNMRLLLLVMWSYVLSDACNGAVYFSRVPLDTKTKGLLTKKRKRK